MGAGARAERPGVGRAALGDLATLLAALAVIWTSALWLLQGERADAMHAAHRTAATLALAFTETADQSVQRIERALDVIRARHERGEPDKDRPAVTGVQLTIGNRAGLVTWSNAGAVGDGESVDLAAHPAFRHFADGTVDDLFVGVPEPGSSEPGPPEPGSAARPWSIPFVRRLRTADGAFDGIVAAEIDPDMLVARLQAGDLGPHGAVTLLREDGAVLARVGGVAAGVLLGDRRADMSLAAGVAQGAASAPASDAARLRTVRRVLGAPLLVSVALDPADVLLRWRADRSVALLAASVLTLLAAAAWLRVRGLAVAGIRGRRTLDAVLACAGIGLVAVDERGRPTAINAQAAEMLDLRTPSFPPGEASALLAEVAPALRLRLALADDAPRLIRHSRLDGRVIETGSHVRPDGMRVRSYADVTDFHRRANAAAPAVAMDMGRPGQADAAHPRAPGTRLGRAGSVDLSVIIDGLGGFDRLADPKPVASRSSAMSRDRLFQSAAPTN